MKPLELELGESMVSGKRDYKQILIINVQTETGNFKLECTSANLILL